MGTILHFPILRTSRCVPPEERAGDLLAMRHVDLETAVETVRILRTLEDQSFLDCFNRLDRAERRSA
jgi:hypothetical protein